MLSLDDVKKINLYLLKLEDYLKSDLERNYQMAVKDDISEVINLFNKTLELEVKMTIDGKELSLSK